MIEAHKCNVQGCKGYVCFDNADFDMNDIPLNENLNAYAYAEPQCTECGKVFYVVPHYMVIDVTDKELGDYKQLKSACMGDFELRQKQIKFNNETDPRVKIQMYIDHCGYTYKVDDVIRGYKDSLNKNYLSYTMKDCVTKLKKELEQLVNSV